MPEWFGSSLFKHWHCSFPFEKAPLDKKAEKIIIREPRIEQLAERMSLGGCRILELGCLEGLHSFLLSNLGASEIIAIEGRRENYLKCLMVKNAFHLEKCTFLFGDVNDILPQLRSHFDLCLALGILYHLENPVEVVYRIAQISDSIFAWTHYSSDGFPVGRLATLRYGNAQYSGRCVGEDPRHYLSGLQGSSFWLCEEDLLRLFSDAGFKNIEVIMKETHEHGPAITLLAKK